MGDLLTLYTISQSVSLYTVELGTIDWNDETQRPHPWELRVPG